LRGGTTKHKIVRNDFEQALLGPKGEGQEARSNLQKAAIYDKIAAVILFLRNDRKYLAICLYHSMLKYDFNPKKTPFS